LSYLLKNTKHVCNLESYFIERKWYFFLEISGLRNESIGEDRKKISTLILAEIEKEIKKKLVLTELSFPKPSILDFSYIQKNGEIKTNKRELSEFLVRSIYQKRLRNLF